MPDFHLPGDLRERFGAFLASDEFSNFAPEAKSEYWEYHSQAISVRINGDIVTLGGKSGNYIPAPKGKRRFSSKPRLTNKLRAARKAFRDPEALRMLSLTAAFDLVMAERPASGWRIPFVDIAKRQSAFPTSASVAASWFGKAKYAFTDDLLSYYYLYNVLTGLAETDRIHTVLEIGAGNGNMCALLHHHLGANALIVDLPETLCLSIIFLSDLFPDASILLPHEMDRFEPGKYDFVFLTPAQINLLPDGCVDLSLNKSSFQEMTPAQVQEYFALIQRATKPGGWFLCLNRGEKIPGVTAAPMRFAEYPWNPANKVLAYEECRLGRITKPDSHWIRLEQIPFHEEKQR
ncbi:MAG: putative sugar O-methyltransferase [Desulfovibrio sp.]